MKKCANCAASNLDGADFCIDCGAALEDPYKRVPPASTDNTPLRKVTATDVTDATIRSGDTASPPGSKAKRGLKLPPLTRTDATVRSAKTKEHVNIDADYLARTIDSRLGTLSTLKNKQRADIMFILDCTESMKGELGAIRDAIMSFVETIRSDGVRVRIGLIEFRDRLINEEHRVLSFNGDTFTSDPELFRREVFKLSAIGGGDEPESSLDAVMLALRQPFDKESQKVLVLVTDAPPHIPDKETQSVEAVSHAIREAAISQLYLVIPVQETKNQVYLKLCQGIRSMAFDLGQGDDFNRRAEDFKRTLMSLGKTISAATR